MIFKRLGISCQAQADYIRDHKRL